MTVIVLEFVCAKNIVVVMMVRLYFGLPTSCPRSAPLLYKVYVCVCTIGDEAYGLPPTLCAEHRTAASCYRLLV